mgnify:CR=1 FL=1
MNKKLLIFLFLISLNFLNSQINIKKIEYIGDTIVKLSKKYDGKSDFIEQKNIDDYKQYIEELIERENTFTMKDFPLVLMNFQHLESMIYKKEKEV